MAAPKTRVESVMEDPSAQAIARVYADAFLNAIPAGQGDALLDEFQSFVDEVYHKFPDFVRLLSSPSVSKEDKLAMVDRVAANRASPLFGNFLRVLARHERLDLLPLVLDQTRRNHEIRSGKKRVEVESAAPLSDASLQSLKQTLKTMVRAEPIVELRVNPELLGGLRVRVDDTIYDTSLRSRLNQLQHALRERSLHEIQSGRDRFSHHEGN